MRRSIIGAALALALSASSAMAAGTSAWIGGNGQGLTYGSAGFTATDFNSLAAGSAVVATSAITNTAALDIYADVSFTVTIGAGATTTGSYLTLYLLPLNQDGTTYGDGTATGTTPPTGSYTVATATIKSGVASAAVTGTFRGVLLPPGNFKFAIANNATAFAASAAATFSYRTYNENLNR